MKDLRDLIISPKDAARLHDGFMFRFTGLPLRKNSFMLKQPKLIRRTTITLISKIAHRLPRCLVVLQAIKVLYSSWIHAAHDNTL